MGFRDKLYIIYDKSEFSLPEYVGFSVAELSKKTGLTKETLSTYFSKARKCPDHIYKGREYRVYEKGEK